DVQRLNGSTIRASRFRAGPRPAGDREDENSCDSSRIRRISSREQGRVVEIEGVETWYCERGSGAPLLLIHGSAPGIDTATAWAPILDDLAAHRRTIIVDAPGYGRSQMLPVADTPRNVALHLVKLLDSLAIDELVVAGHSRGGRIATELAF